MKKLKTKNNLGYLFSTILLLLLPSVAFATDVRDTWPRLFNILSGLLLIGFWLFLIISAIIAVVISIRKNYSLGKGITITLVIAIIGNILIPIAWSLATYFYQKSNKI